MNNFYLTYFWSMKPSYAYLLSTNFGSLPPCSQLERKIVPKCVSEEKMQEIIMKTYQNIQNQDGKNGANLQEQGIIEESSIFKNQSPPFISNLYKEVNQKDQSKVSIENPKSTQLKQSQTQERENLSPSCKWTAEEDEKLKQYVDIFGKSWNYIRSLMPRKTIKQIRERYLNNFDIKNSQHLWQLKDDLKLLNLIKQYGYNWKKIQRKMFLKTEAEIRSRYYGYILKNKKNYQSKNACANQKEAENNL